MAYEQSLNTREIDWGKIIETALDMPGNISSTFNRFYPYSYANQAYLWMQGAREPVATYRRWQTLGRQVVKGSKAYEIIKPVTVKRENKDGEAERVIVGFKEVRCLFTYSQTEGDELPPVQLPEWDTDTALEKLNITKVPFRRNDARIQGYSYGRNVSVNPFAEFPEKTLMHELGHVILGHTTPEMLAEYEQHRGLMEFGAEGTAHLVMNELGTLTDDMAAYSRSYIQGWLKGERPPDKAIKEVFTATDLILKSGRLVVGNVINGGEE